MLGVEYLIYSLSKQVPGLELLLRSLALSGRYHLLIADSTVFARRIREEHRSPLDYLGETKGLSSE